MSASAVVLKYDEMEWGDTMGEVWAVMVERHGGAALGLEERKELAAIGLSARQVRTARL